ncbi:MAG: nitrite reductase small subunit NirD [Thioalkalivibrionaceae bacterium]
MKGQAALIEVCLLEDIPRLGSRVVIGRQGAVALFRTADDRVFALDDRYPHKGGPLSQGIVHGERVTCPLHNWVIGLADGEAQGADSGCVAHHPVVLREGRVWLERAILFGTPDVVTTPVDSAAMPVSLASEA